MADASEHVSFKKYSVKPVCTGCGRKIRRDDNLWFQGFPRCGVWAFSCCKHLAAKG